MHNGRAFQIRMLGFVSLFFAFSAFAKPIHIIHTNDLHSFMEGTRNQKGGYARVKTVIDRLKKESDDKGIETLIIDGGDFGEGSALFLSDRGSDSIRALSMLGVEAAVIGNHDQLMGGKFLSEQIKRANVRTKILSANLKTSPDMEIDDVVYPYADFKKGGVSIRVIGLSTPELHYQFPLYPGRMKAPRPIGNRYANNAKAEGIELVIALTHLGVKKDKQLIRSSHSFDLVVGGHSHARLEKVVYETNKNGEKIPIVQTGAHGIAVGSLYIDVQPDEKAKVISYELRDVTPEIPEEVAMKDFVVTAKENLKIALGRDPEEVIGESSIPLTGYVDGHNEMVASCWDDHMVEITRSAVGADTGIYLSTFNGEQVSPGKITYRDIIDNFPHMSEYGTPGWEIVTFSIRGFTLRALAKALYALPLDFGIRIAGLTFDSKKIPDWIPLIGGQKWIYNLRLDGRRIRDFRNYSMAMPSEIPDFLIGLLKGAGRAVFRDLHYTGVFYWPAMEAYFKQNSPLACMK